MIGDSYWSTGISIQKDDGKWKVWLDFLDNGWVPEWDATEGRLRVCYQVDDLTRAIDTLKADAERIGITWKDPTIYYPGDGEWEDVEYPPDWREITVVQSERLGWRAVYGKDEVPA